jgi:hypothetical protein
LSKVSSELVSPASLRTVSSPSSLKVAISPTEVSVGGLFLSSRHEVLKSPAGLRVFFPSRSEDCCLPSGCGLFSPAKSPSESGSVEVVSSEGYHFPSSAIPQHDREVGVFPTSDSPVELVSLSFRECQISKYPRQNCCMSPQSWKIESELCAQQSDHLLSQQEFSSLCILHIVIIICIRILKSRSISIQCGALRHRKLKHMHTCIKPDWIISPEETDHFSTSV